MWFSFHYLYVCTCVAVLVIQLFYTIMYVCMYLICRFQNPMYFETQRVVWLHNDILEVLSYIHVFVCMSQKQCILEQQTLLLSLLLHINKCMFKLNRIAFCLFWLSYHVPYMLFHFTEYLALNIHIHKMGMNVRLHVLWPSTVFWFFFFANNHVLELFVCNFCLLGRNSKLNELYKHQLSTVVIGCD